MAFLRPSSAYRVFVVEKKGPAHHVEAEVARLFLADDVADVNDEVTDCIAG